MISYCPNVLREDLFTKQKRFRNQPQPEVIFERSGDGDQARNEEDEQRLLETQEKEFSQSLDLSSRPGTAKSHSTGPSSFTQSVVVAGSERGGYKVYNSPHDRHEDTDQTDKYSTITDHGEKLRLFTQSQSYDHNIGNPGLINLRKSLDGSLKVGRRRKSFPRYVPEKKPLPKFEPENKPPKTSRKKSRHSKQDCDCGQYHSHKLGNHDFTVSINNLFTVTESRIQFPGREQVVANHVTIANVFWKPNLAFCPYRHGDKRVSFESLWPPAEVIRGQLQEGIEDTGLRLALLELCLLSIISGPLAVLKSILNLKFIRIDHQFENDAGLLHLACLLRNSEAIDVIVKSNVSPKLKDKSGRTAGQVCYCPKIRKELPVWYKSSFISDRNKYPQVVIPSLQDRDSIFASARNPKDFYELQRKLQSFDFPVNTQDNEDGDFLIHVACKTGISHLPLILSLMKLQNADINLYNGEGMTPLMIVAKDGDSILCDLLMCLFGADPNLQHTENGKTALHYAALGNHVNVVNCLLKRGVDVNIEDQNACRADDMVQTNTGETDCREVIHMHRQDRCQSLATLAQSDVVYPINLRQPELNLRKTDLIVTDQDGFTLVMLAAVYDKMNNLETLLNVSNATIDAQHIKTGLTALAMAAKAGFHNSCKILLKNGASPAIKDMQDYLPLHHAVLGNHEKVVEIFFQYEQTTYVGLYKALRFCRKSSIHDILTKAWEMRQEKIVSPQIRIASLQGDADKLYCILEEGDNVDIKGDLNTKSGLFVAVENSHIEVIKLLIDRGADLRKRDTDSGNTVLHVVCKTGNFEIAQYLLRFCQLEGNNSKTRIDINALNNDRKTALQVASEKGFIRLITLLIKMGATTALLNSQGTLFTCPEFEGARIEIERHRAEHTLQVMSLIEDKSKRAFEALKAIWVPRFDHNLRDQNGNTPLMVACRLGRERLVKYLLPSAVYANHIMNDDDDTRSVDSGVPDLPPWKSRAESVMGNPEEYLEKSGDFDETMPLGASCEVTSTLNPSDFLNTIPATPSTMGSSHMNTFLTDVERPKGLYIYHDGIVSHVCAVNLYTGNTPLHCALEGGDNMVVVSSLLEADNAVINMQNAAGLTPLHVACKYVRKKCIQVLLGCPGLDLNLRSLNGGLPEDMTKNSSIKKLMNKARSGQPVPQIPQAGISDSRSVAGFTESLPRSIGKASTIDFDKINGVYQSMKYEPPK